MKNPKSKIAKVYNPAELLIINGRKRRGRKANMTHKKRNPTRRTAAVKHGFHLAKNGRRRRRVTNPAAKQLLSGAIYAALGATGVNALTNLGPLENLAPWYKVIVKLVASFAAGKALDKYVSPNAGLFVAVGGASAAVAQAVNILLASYKGLGALFGSGDQTQPLVVAPTVAAALPAGAPVVTQAGLPAGAVPSGSGVGYMYESDLMDVVSEEGMYDPYWGFSSGLGLGQLNDIVNATM